MPVKESQEGWELGFGAQVREDGGVEFGVWAPRVKKLEVCISGKQSRTVPLVQVADGEFRTTVPNVPRGSDYLYVLNGDRERPDPVSRCQPYGVHKASRVVDPDEFDWSDDEWPGIPLQEYLIYELHTGTFTLEGTFEGVIPFLPYLKDLGITAVELMPVASFPGARNWGYDGVSLYAPQSSYGGPSGLKKLVNACHRAGLAVVLDVVYNHLGPEGNYLNEFAPFFTHAYRTPWGDALNFDGPDSDGVRRFFINNALYWLTEYHVDALRLDAIHGIFDFSARHIVEELTESFHAQARLLGRSAWIIAECDLDDVRVIRPKALGGYGVDAQWHDDFHHALSTVLTGKNPGYLQDFGKLDQLAKAIREGFVFDGQYSRYRRRRFGSSSSDRPGEQFVSFIQNHDQVANASQGQRLASRVSLEQQKLAAVLLVLSPFLPLFFMGQEYGTTTPFFYFTNFGDPALSQAVSQGRKKDCAAFGTDLEFADPEAAPTFNRSILDWDCLEQSPHANVLRLYRDLIALRKQHACLANCRKDLTSVEFDENARWLVMKRGDPSGSAAFIVCNFAPYTRSVSTAVPEGSWQLALWTGARPYGGQGSTSPPDYVDVRQAPIEIEVAGFTSAVYLRQVAAPAPVA